MSDNNHLVSIIIPTYNRSKELVRCLDSISQQSYKNYEVIVCDDGSTDDTKKVVEKYRDKMNIIYLYQNNSGGPAKPRNLGIKNAKGFYISFLDSDDWWCKQKLVESIKILDRGYEFVYHDLIRINEKNKRLRQPIFLKKVNFEYECLLTNGNFIYNSSVVIRASIIKRVGYFSEDLNLVSAEDFDYWIRASKIVRKFKKLDKPYGFYSYSLDSISNPIRTINYLNFLENKYTTLNDKSKKYYIFYYLRAVCFKRLGNYSLAQNELKKINLYKVPFMRVIKILFYYSFIKYKNWIRFGK